MIVCSHFPTRDQNLHRVVALEEEEDEEEEDEGNWV